MHQGHKPLKDYYFGTTCSSKILNFSCQTATVSQGSEIVIFALSDLMSFSFISFHIHSTGSGASMQDQTTN